MDLHFVSPPGDKLTRVIVNGKLIAEVACAHGESRDDLEERVRKARRLEWLPNELLRALKDANRAVNINDHLRKTSDSRKAAFIRGLFDGLHLRLEIDEFAKADLPPDHRSSYQAGYEYGSPIGEILARLSERGEFRRII